jgi:hypothetical protein
MPHRFPTGSSTRGVERQARRPGTRKPTATRLPIVQRNRSPYSTRDLRYLRPAAVDRTMQRLSTMSGVQPSLAYRSHMFYGPLPLYTLGTAASSPHELHRLRIPFHSYSFAIVSFLVRTLCSAGTHAAGLRLSSLCVLHTKYPGSYTGLHWLKRSFCVWIPVWFVNRHPRLVLLCQQTPAFGLEMAYLAFCFGGIIGLWRSCVLFACAKRTSLQPPHDGITYSKAPLPACGVLSLCKLCKLRISIVFGVPTQT